MPVFSIKDLQAFPDYLKATPREFSFRESSVFSLTPYWEFFPNQIALCYRIMRPWKNRKRSARKGFHTLIGHQEPSLSISSSPSAYIREEERYFVTPIDQSQEDCSIDGQTRKLYCHPWTSRDWEVSGDCEYDCRCHGPWKKGPGSLPKTGCIGRGLQTTRRSGPAYLFHAGPRFQV